MAAPAGRCGGHSVSARRAGPVLRGPQGDRHFLRPGDGLNEDVSRVVEIRKPDDRRAECGHLEQVGPRGAVEHREIDTETCPDRKTDNQQFRRIKAATPGAYTFILEATKEVPRRLSHPSRKTIGLRVPDHKVLQELLALYNTPLLATTLIASGETEPMNDADEISAHYKGSIAAIIDAGACPREPTTVVDLTGGEPVIVREGRGSLAALGL